MDGVLLDARAARGGLELVLATRRGLETTRTPGYYLVYLLPLPRLEPEGLASSLSEACRAWVEEWKAPPWYERDVRVVVCSSGDPNLVIGIARRLERAGAARRVNTYPGLLWDALLARGLRPGLRYRSTPAGLEALEDPDEPLYPDPGLRVARVEAYSWYGPAARPLGIERITAECCGDTIHTRSAAEALEALRSWRPHIVEARGPARMALGGRGGWLWLDPEQVPVGATGVIEWMRVSGLTFTQAARASIGKILTAAEALEARRRRYLLDPEAPRVERPRPLTALAGADMAGAARVPDPGIYWGVAQLDYSSLYPSIISLYNISSETVNRPRCPRPLRVDGHDGYICGEPRGLVASVLGALVERRMRIRRAKQGAPRLGEREEALKWILVAGFGYLGYRNSLFGSITAYELVTALARRMLRAAEEAAEDHGYRVIHSLVDSVFIQPATPGAPPPDEVARAIMSKTGIHVKVEAVFRWLYIPPTRRGTGAPGKYFGPIAGGGVKVRGLASRRRNTPPFIARLQRGGIAVLSRATSPWELERLSRRVELSFAMASEALAEGLVDPSLLVVRERDRAYIATPRGPWPAWLGRPSRYDPRFYLVRLLTAARELPLGLPAEEYHGREGQHHAKGLPNPNLLSEEEPRQHHGNSRVQCGQGHHYRGPATPL